jgi:hypothetical protein
MDEPIHYYHCEPRLVGAWQSQIIPLRLLRRSASRKDKGKRREVILFRYGLVEGKSCAKISLLRKNAYL